MRSKKIGKSKPGGETTTTIDEVKKRAVKIFFSTIKKDHKTKEEAFTAALIILYHEYKHLQQFDEMKKENCNPDLCFSFLSMKYRPDFYQINHDRFIIELEAEKYGLEEAYKYLSNQTDATDAFKRIKQYIKNLSKDRPLYQGKDVLECKSMDDVTAYFNDPKRQTGYDIKPIIKTIANQTVEIMEILSSAQEQSKYYSSLVLEYNPTWRNFFGPEAVKKIDIDCYSKAYESLPQSLTQAEKEEMFLDELRKQMLKKHR